MNKFTKLVMSPLPGGKKWRLVESMSYHVGKQNGLNDRGIIIEVPAGFITDLASVPRVFYSIIPPWGKYGKSAVLHDFLYFKHTFSRKLSDQIFESGMKFLGVPKLKRKIIYYSVRAFGGAAWKSHRGN